MENEQIQQQPQQPQSNALAIWALITGLFCGIVGVVLGIIGINKYPAGSSGRTMSIIGLVLGAIGVVGSIMLQLR